MPRSPARPSHGQAGAGAIVLASLAGLIGGALSLALRLPGLQAPWRALAMQHGPILVFFSAIPALIGGFGVWLVPGQIGAANTAFPRLAVAALGLMVAGFVLALGGLLLAAPGALLLLAVALAAAGIVLCAANLVATMLNERVAGMRLGAMPLLSWSQLIASGLAICALPVLLGVLVALPRHGTPTSATLLHLFRALAYPGFCIMILPAIGLVGEVIDRPGRDRPAAPALVAAMTVLAISSFMVWARPLLARSGGGSGLLETLSVITPLLAVCLLWLRSLRRPSGFRTVLRTVPGLYALGFIVVLVGGVAGGLVTGTSFSPAHLHYMLSLGTLFALFAGFYDRIGPLTGRGYPRPLAVAQFWLLAFGIDLGVLPWSSLAAAGAALTSLSLLLFGIIVATIAVGRTAPDVAFRRISP